MLEMAVRLDKKAKTPVYLQLYNHIKKEITAGRMETGLKMASIRELSAYLNISKNTVETAYQQLCAEGYLVSEPKAGYFVNRIENIADLHASTASNEQAAVACAGNNLARYDFSSDYLDEESFNFSLWKRFIGKAMKDPQRYLSYGSHLGEPELRREIAKYLRHSRGVICSAEQVAIGAGVQSLLHVLCEVLKPRYETIAFEDPGFKKAQYIFKDHNFRIIPIRLENDGIDVNALAACGAKLVHVSPSHQFPTGSIMPVNKRVQLLKWAQASEGMIIEDDYDSELRYFGRPIPSLQGLNNGANVIYMGTFSKIFLPSLRISYMVLPERLLSNYLEKAARYNQTSSTIEQIALSLFMKDGLMEKHLRRLRKIYAKKNQLLTESFGKIMKDKVVIRGQGTGLHLLLEIKSALTVEKIVELAEKAGVRVIPISSYSIEKTASKFPQVLLSYGGIPKEDIVPAVRLLNKAWFEGD
ncbi:MAG: PLP-dependent aminotransferase family protein [Peptococcaceae bacterium]|jgi:GntR family transcriptional regulator/MocR family aminotransferase|nr:PLP-dependent aminotransferase family protein [Peptococcaceae bacterium]MDH7525892.1 PLP-dependent aminotransferase family protein [Peptococcaceae bacterium]